MSDFQIEKAVNCLQNGFLVAFPTETVFGLGADATNPSAVNRIFEVKNRPKNHPLIVHVKSIFIAKKLTNSWSEYAEVLSNTFWPGPLTLLIKKNFFLPDNVTGGQENIGIRVPSHPFALKLLSKFSEAGSGMIAAPSANRFGEVSTTLSEDVKRSIGSALGSRDMIVSDKLCALGLESTIVDCTGTKPKILRLGAINRALIEDVLKLKISHVNETEENKKISGSFKIHYSPNTPLFLLNKLEVIEFLKKQLFESKKSKFFFWGFSFLKIDHSNLDQQIAPNDPLEYARKMYALLNKIDQLEYEKIFFERPPQTKYWEAIIDRLNKASYKFRN